MKDRFFHARTEWERLALMELYREYAQALRNRKVVLRQAAIEIFDSETFWGQWDPVSRTIRIARRLLKSHNWFQVVGILLHEMAHQLADETAPGRIPARQTHETQHGESFKRACKRLGVPAEFSKASADLQSHSLDWREQKRDEAAEKMLEKVQKLLALAESSNENEALLAMNRVRELYAKHNLEQLGRDQESDIVHIIVSSGSKRIESYEQQIVGILVGHFFVQILAGPLYDVPSGEYHRVLEIIGTRENAIMAEYVFYFLKQQVKHHLQEAEKSRGRKFNRLEKKSYRMGILRGFDAKLKDAEKPGRDSAGKSSAGSASTGRNGGTTSGTTAANTDRMDVGAKDFDSGSGQSSFGRTPESLDIAKDQLVGRALVAFEKNQTLNDYISHIYPRIRRGSGTAQTIDVNAYSAGHDAGKKISLNRPISSSDGSKGKLLGTRG